MWCLAACWIGSLHADPASIQPDTAVGLVATGGTIVSDPVMPAYDFGPRLLTDETPITRVFVLQNKTGHTLTIDLLRPGCGCISAVIDLTPPQTLPYIVGTGKSVPILVTLEPEASASGPLKKDVSVFLHGHPQAAAVLTLRGTILPAPKPV